MAINSSILLANKQKNNDLTPTTTTKILPPNLPFEQFLFVVSTMGRKSHFRLSIVIICKILDKWLHWAFVKIISLSPGNTRIGQ